MKSAWAYRELLVRRILEWERELLRRQVGQLEHERVRDLLDGAGLRIPYVLADRGIRHDFEAILRAPEVGLEIVRDLGEQLRGAPVSLLRKGIDVAPTRRSAGRALISVPRTLEVDAKLRSGTRARSAFHRVLDVRDLPDLPPGAETDATVMDGRERALEEDERTAGALDDATEIHAGALADTPPEAVEAGSGTIAGQGSETPASAVSPITPREALRHEELATTRRFALLIYAAAVVMLVAMLLLSGDQLAERLALAGLVVTAGAALWLRSLLEHPERYVGLRAVTCWGLCTLGALSGVYYAGAFSPAPVLFCLGIYVIALGQSRATAWVVYGMCAAFQAGLSALILTGFIADAGIMALPESLATRDAAIIQAVVQSSLLGAFVLGRTSRAARLRALSELEREKRELVERQGLLEEAREDLDRALRLGQSGRFTERRVGSYRLGALIGRGSMGDVYEAAHADTGSLAAIKLIHSELLERAENRTRFARELAIAASLKVPNVVRVLEMSAPEAPLPYLAMERLFGHNLFYHLRGGGRLSPEEALMLARQVGRGIDAAARAGIIHRDLKPQNLFLHEPPTRKPIWKILDFGVSKLAESGDTLTHGRIIGTPAYMAPEQAQAGSIDSRADVYALGAILYRALTGRKPFSEGDVAKTLFAVVYTMPPRPSEVADLSPELDAVLAVALAKHPASRFQSGIELADALGQALAGKLVPATEERAQALARELPWGATSPQRTPRPSKAATSPAH